MKGMNGAFDSQPQPTIHKPTTHRTPAPHLFRSWDHGLYNMAIILCQDTCHQFIKGFILLRFYSH